MRHWILAAFLAVGLTGCFSDNDEAQKETVTLEETRDTPRGISGWS